MVGARRVAHGTLLLYSVEGSIGLIYSVLPFTGVAKSTFRLWKLSQPQRQVDGAARRRQYGRGTPKVVIALDGMEQARDDMGPAGYQPQS